MSEMVERVARAIAAAASESDVFYYEYEKRKEHMDAIARAAIEAIEAAGFRIVKDVQPGEASRPGFDMRSYEVGYMEGENNAKADAALKDGN